MFYSIVASALRFNEAIEFGGFKGFKVPLLDETLFLWIIKHTQVCVCVWYAWGRFRKLLCTFKFKLCVDNYLMSYSLEFVFFYYFDLLLSSTTILCVCLQEDRVMSMMTTRSLTASPSKLKVRSTC